jgi:hypothetical protein
MHMTAHRDRTRATALESEAAEVGISALALMGFGICSGPVLRAPTRTIRRARARIALSRTGDAGLTWFTS